MTTGNEQLQDAESLRKSGNYEEAESLFRDLWQEHPTAAAGAGWIHCLRKLKRNSEAMEISTKVMERFPDNDWVRIEDEWARKTLAWSIYSNEVKPAREQKDLGRAIHFAQKMLELTDDPLVKRRAVFTVVGTAKECGRWDIVSSWCDHLDREQLSADSPDPKSMPERQKWYFDKIKALIKLEQWLEAQLLAREASATFPRKDDFHRWAAQARAKQGDVAGGVEELEAIVRRGRVQWYILHELAELQHELGTNDEALRNACKAALDPGEDKLKVKLYEFLARIQLHLGKVKAAWQSVELSKGIRQREGWGINSALVQLSQEVNDKLAIAGIVLESPSVADLYESCVSDWREEVISGQIRYVGHVSRLIDGKDFAFIAPDAGGENVYVKLRDLPRAAQKVSARVEYTLVNAYDKKKERDTVRAADVHLLE